MKKFLLSLVLCCLWSIQGIRAQDLIEPSHSCRTKEVNDLQLKRNPKSLKERDAFNLFSKEYARKLKTQKSAATTTYIIPVVFHVYGTSFNGKTVTLEKIKTALMHLNEDFQGLNDDFNSVEPFFQARRGTLNIEFRLAQKDPNGGCTTGVIFEGKKNGYGGTSAEVETQISADAWDNYKYMNVYIQNDLYSDGKTNNSGVCWYPNTDMSDNGLARCVYNGAYLGENTNKEFASVLTHEFGHFMNLIHTFDGGCAGTDEVDDTPIEDGKHSLACTPGTNCTGDKVNIENYMGYNAAQGCSKMYTQGQVARMLAALQHPARKTLWSAQNIIDTGVDATGSSLTANSTKFKEVAANNGAIAGSSIVTLTGKTFSKSAGTLTAGVDFKATLPAGLTAVVTLNSNTQATVTITGTATSHLSVNNTNVGITFLAPSITGGVSGMLCNGLNWNLKFRDAYGIFFVDIDDKTVSATATWKNVNTEIGDEKFYGAWQYAANHLKFETYGKRLVTNTGTNNISPLGFNTAINASSNFTAPGAYPNQLDVRTPTYTTWDGKTDYFGFEYSIDDEKCYGWFKAVVAANGSGYSITEYGYNTQPGATIYTGMTDKIALSVSPTTLSEAAANDGGITQVSSFKLTTNNGTFTKSTGTLTLGTDYTISGIPAGLTAKLNVVSNTEVQLVFTGKATNHLKNNSTSVAVAFLNPAITGGIAALSSTGAAIAIKFNDPYGIVHVKDLTNLDRTTVDATDTWGFLRITADADQQDYGLFVDKGDLKLETYTKSIVCEGSSLNITMIGANKLIDGNSNFVAGGDYPNEQLLRGANYKVWDGKTGYIGFKFTIGGQPCYGWFKVKVNAKGTGYTLLEYAYNTEPNGGITTEGIPADLTVHLANTPDVINEDLLSNDGSFSTKIDIQLTTNGGTFTKSTGNLVAGTDFTITGLPAGLTAAIAVIDNKKLQLSYTGKATANELANGTTATITFLDPAITGGAAVLDANYFTTKFVFMNAYKIVYVDLPAPLTVSASNTWAPFDITAAADKTNYGLYFSGNELRLVNNDLNSLVCQSGSDNLSFLGNGAKIDETNNWYKAIYNTVRSSSYTVWDGKTGYIGFKYTKSGFSHYGYFEVKVSADGQSYSIAKYAYNTAPQASITTPAQLGSVKMTNTPAAIAEDEPTNNGTFNTTIAVQLTTNGGTFTKSSGNLVEGTDFTIAGLPAGLTVNISLTNNTTAVVSYTGKATANEVANASTATITFLDAAITGGAAVLESKSFTTGFTFIDKKFVKMTNTPAVIAEDKLTNNGTFSTTIAVQLTTNGGTFTKSSGSLVEGTDFTVTGLPAGLTASISLTNNTSAVVSYTGKATAKDIATATITFLNAAITGGATVLENKSFTTEFTFSTLNTTDFERTVSYTNYPNPFYEVINISSASFSGKKVEVLIYNDLGQNLFSKSYDKDNETIAIDGSNFGTGFYYLKVIVDSKVQAVKKIMKN
jgi:hypothetical protein